MPRQRTKYDRPEALDTLFERVRTLAAQNGDPLLAAFEITERLTAEQAQEMYALLLAEGAPTPAGLAFSAGEADLLQLLSARQQKPLKWTHCVVTLDGVTIEDGRYVEERKGVQ